MKLWPKKPTAQNLQRVTLQILELILPVAEIASIAGM